MDPQNPNYTYDAKVDDVIDGDTYDLRLRLGFGVETRVRMRLRGVDTHEIYGGYPKESDEYQKGMEERRFVVEWLTAAARDAPMDEWPLVVETEDTTGRHGQPFADVYRKADGERLQDALVAEYEDLDTRSVEE